jgi:hypothetical protein
MKIIKERLSIYAIILFVIAAADLISTLIILSLGGGEANPFFNFILRHGGIEPFIFAKLATLLLIPFIDLSRLIKTPTIEWSGSKVIKLPRLGRLKSVPQKRIRTYFIASIICYLGVYTFFLVWVNF